MIQPYIGLHFTLKPLQPVRDILIAELSLADFESFVETESGLTAYIPKKDWDLKRLDTVNALHNKSFEIQYTIEEIEPVNWNESWEKNFNPITIDHMVHIRAPFHKKSDLPYDILIEPKMSFGTGHHETTHLMVQHLLKLDLKGKRVLDMGCGTGVLAILAEMRGAVQLDAIDIDPWCYENSLENTLKNRCKNITVYQGDATAIKNSYDLIIANINRNILLQDLATYTKHLQKDGKLLLSGFYVEDIPVIDTEASKHGLRLELRLERNRWAGLRYTL